MGVIGGFLLIVTAAYMAGAAPDSNVSVRFEARGQDTAVCQRVERAIVGTMRRNGAVDIKTTGCRG